MSAARDVSFSATTNWLIRAGSITRNAWGSRMEPIDCLAVKPMAKPASP